MARADTVTKNSSSIAHEPQRRPAARGLVWVILLIVVLGIVAYIRLRLVATPLERDEGEYAYAGQLLLQGVPPYQDLYSMKWPGTFGAYALIMAIFGQTVAGIHLGLWLVTLGTALLTFLLGRKIVGSLGGVVAAGTDALLAIIPASYGLAAHATHFVILPALAGVLLIYEPGQRRPWLRLVLGGALLGLATLMKQAGAAFALWAGFWVIWQELSHAERNWRRLVRRAAWLVGGFCLPLLLTALLLTTAGVFNRFWFWTIDYAAAYARLNTFQDAVGSFLGHFVQVTKPALGLWGLAGAGLMVLMAHQQLRLPRQTIAMVLSFVLFSFLAVCPGGYFRGHYFLVLFPAAGLLAGLAVETARHLLERQRFLRLAPVFLFVAAAGWCLYASREIFFYETPVQVCRTQYGANPFPESIAIGRYLENHCPADARIAVMGSEPQIYFYSHRRSATGYIYTYPLLENQPYARAMQAEMIQELTNAKPAYFVFVSHTSSWVPRDNSDFGVIEWFNQYKQAHLETVGYVDLAAGREWDGSLAGNPKSDQWVQICRQRD